MRSISETVTCAKRLGLPAVALLVSVACSESIPTETDGLSMQADVTGRPAGVPVPIFKIPVWGNDELWQALSTHEPSNAGERSHAQWIVMGAVDDTDPHSPFFFGDHDHVMAVPKGNRGTFSAIWHLVFLVPADGATVGTDVLTRDPPPSDPDFVPLFDPGPLAYAADLDGDAMVEQGEELTSLTKVNRALSLGLVKIQDIWAEQFGSPFIFVCPIRPL